MFEFNQQHMKSLMGFIELKISSFESQTYLILHREVCFLHSQDQLADALNRLRNYRVFRNVVHQLRDGELLLAFEIWALDLSVEANLFVFDSLLADGLLVAAVDTEPTGDG